MTNRPKIIAGNWKMYKTIAEAIQFLLSFIPKVQGAKSHIYIAAPFTAIAACVHFCKETAIHIGAQNMSDKDEGAFTGEISAAMLKDAGARFVLLGHSERREHFGETDLHIHHKLKQSIAAQIPAILCIGEKQEAREKGGSATVLKKQLDAALNGINPADLSSLIIAYEPVWAIGTGKTATPEIAEETHHMIRDHLAKHVNKSFAQNIPLLYGGSVKPNNIGSLLQQPNIDGALIGGASLDVESFAQMVLQ